MLVDDICFLLFMFITLTLPYVFVKMIAVKCSKLIEIMRYIEYRLYLKHQVHLQKRKMFNLI